MDEPQEEPRLDESIYRAEQEIMRKIYAMLSGTFWSPSIKTSSLDFCSENLCLENLETFSWVHFEGRSRIEHA